MTSYALGTSSAGAAPAIPPREPQHPPSLFFPRRARGRVSTRAPERGPARVGRARTRSGIGGRTPRARRRSRARNPETGNPRGGDDETGSRRRRGETPANEPSSFATWTIDRRARRTRATRRGRRETRTPRARVPSSRDARDAEAGKGRGARAPRARYGPGALPERRAAWPRPRRVRRGAPAGGRSDDSPTTAGQRTLLLVPGWEGSEVTLDTDFFGGDAERSSLVARRSSPLAASTPTRVPARLSLRAKSEDPPPTARARPGHPPNTRRAPLISTFESSFSEIERANTRVTCRTASSSSS